MTVKMYKFAPFFPIVAQSRNQRPVVLKSLEKVKICPPSLVELCLRAVADNYLELDVDKAEKVLGHQMEEVSIVLQW